MASKPLCKYGSRCYRKNPDHLRQFAHPGDELEPAEEKKGAGGRRRGKRKQRGEDGGDGATGSDPKRPKLPPGDHSPTESSPTSASQSLQEVEETAAASIPTAELKHASSKERQDVVDSSEVDRGREEGVAHGGEEGGEVMASEDHADEEELARDKACGDMREKVKRKFLVDMPEDFYQFWEFCKSLDPVHPDAALVPALGLELVGPFHVLAGKLEGVPWQKCVLHFRYFYDPPEMVTVARSTSGSGQFHLGYFRDDPSVATAFLVSNDSSVGCEIHLEAEHMFSAIGRQIDVALKTTSTSNDQKKHILSLRSKLDAKITELGLQTTEHKILVKRRNKAVVAKCLHKIGIVVPYDKQTDVGYRPLPMGDRELLKLLNKISGCSDSSQRDRLFEPLQEIITYVQFANDECDYGMGLELGLDLFCHGDHFHRVVSHLLPVAYDLLQREEYGKRLQQHLQHRSHTPLDVSHSLA